MCFADDCTTTEPMVQTDYCKMDFDSCSCLRDPMHSIDMSFIHWLNSPDPENAPNYVKGSIDNIEHSSVSNNITVDDNNNNLSSDLSTLANLVILDGLCEIDVQSEEIAETIENIREIKCKFDFEKDGGGGVVSDVDAAAFRKRAKSSRRRYSRRVVVSKICSDSDYESLNDSNSDTSGKFENENFSRDAWGREGPLCPSSSPLRENRERSKSGRRSKNTPRSVTVKENSETASPSRDSVYCCAAEGCGKIYRRRSHLQAHSRRHTGERPFQCEWKGCQWKFSRSDELVRHHRSHSGEKPFVCQLCDKRFARSDHLKKHMRIHTRPCCDKSP